MGFIEEMMEKNGDKANGQDQAIQKIKRCVNQNFPSEKKTTIQDENDSKYMGRWEV